MKFVKSYVGLVLIVLFTACSSSTKRQHNSIDLESAIETDISLNLSEIVDSIKYIPLETNDSVLIGNNAYVAYGDTDEIFIRSNKLIYRFDTNGNFKNHIGRIGNGPGEFNLIHNISVNHNRKELYLYVGNNNIIIYDFDGTFIKHIKLKTDNVVTIAMITKSNEIIAESRSYSENGISIFLTTFDENGYITNEELIYKDNIDVEVQLQMAPIMYNYLEEIKYKDCYSEKLHAISENINDTISLRLGEYTSDRKSIENIDRANTISNIAKVVDIQESDNLYFFLIVFNERLKAVIKNKHNDKTMFSRFIKMPQRGGGIPCRDLIEYNFWPTFTHKKTAYALLPVDFISEKDLTILSSNHNVSHEDNPILIMAYLK